MFSIINKTLGTLFFHCFHSR